METHRPTKARLLGLLGPLGRGRSSRDASRLRAIPFWVGLTLAATFPLVHCADADPVVPRPSVSDAGTDAAKIDAGCTDRTPSEKVGFEIGQRLPEDLTFQSDGAAGGKASVRVGDYLAPCTQGANLLVFRVSAGFCGPCLWSAAHTQELLKEPRVRFIDVILSDVNNSPAITNDLLGWREKRDVKNDSENLLAVIDPTYRFRAVAPFAQTLPLFVYVDTRTLRVRSFQANPGPEDAAWRIAIELAEMDKAPRPQPPTSQPDYDNYFNRRDWDLIQGMRLPAEPPPDPSNEVADKPAAVSFGTALFSDKTLSPSGTVACSTCHDPFVHFTDGLPVSRGVAKGDRNAPSIEFSAYQRFQFWDGRADTLWAQALGPFENEKEFASSRLFVAHRVFTAYKSEYEALFPNHPMPDLSDTGRFPPAGKPGDAAYDAMTAADKDAVTRVFVNVAKSIAAFERSLRFKPNRLDLYASGDKAALTADEKMALKLFFGSGCAQCHHGPTLSDGAFHNIRFGTGREDGKADEGLSEGAKQLLASPFRADGVYSDAPQLFSNRALDRLFVPEARGRFKTPPLRGVAGTAPYGHGGDVYTLPLLSAHYGKRGLPPGDPRTIGETEPWVPPFDMHAEQMLPVILEVMTSERK